MNRRDRLAVSACAALLLAACAAGSTRDYVVRGPENSYASGQAESAKEWMQKRGIYDYVSYGPNTISFKFGSDDIRTMDYAAFENFIDARIAGQTVASQQRADVRSAEGGVPYAIIYFDDKGRFAQWSRNSLTHGRWWIEGVPKPEQVKMERLGVEPPQRVICFQREVTAGKDTWSVGRPACSPAYEQLIGIHGRKAGDVFNLMSDRSAGTMQADYPNTWPDGELLFLERAPHD